MHAWRAAPVLFLLIATGGAQFQPVDGGDFSGLEVRDDVVAGGNLTGALRVARFVQVSDAHIIDDDAPAPMRVEILDQAAGPFTSAQRPQEEFTDEVLNRAIARINEVHREEPLDFVINTGDNIDNQLENELMRFIDNWEGTHTVEGPRSGLVCQPDGQSESVEDDANDVTDACTSLPEAVATDNVPLEAGLPWFSAFGNHDGLIQGNMPNQPSFNDIAAEYGRSFIDQDEYVAMHFRAGEKCLQGSPMGDVFDDHGHGYGFASGRLCDDDPDNDGYYAFDLRGIRFIVLDTVNDDFVSSNEHLAGQFNPQTTIGNDVIGGYAEGSIDAAQFAWLQSEIDTNQDRLIVLMSHHTVNSMFTNPAAAGCCGPDGESLEDLLTAAGYRTGKQVMDMLADKPNVIAWLGGHTHQHKIEAKNVGAGTSPGFWNIETSSLIDLPQEFRVFEVWVTADRTAGFLTARSDTHDFEQSRELAMGDDQHAAAVATPQDENVLLWFDMAPGVKVSPQPSLPRFLVLSQPAPTMVNGTHGEVGQPVTIQVDARDNLRGEPITGLQLQLSVHHAGDTIGDVVVAVDQRMSETAPGTYTHTFTPVHGGVHFIAVLAADPDGTYQDADLTSSLVIVDPSSRPDAPTDGKDSPGLPLLALLAILVIVARRR